MSELKLPHRVRQHEIDNEACKIVISKFDRNWEIRDLTGRDFGIDKIVERFQDGYATSELLLLQIKGTEKKLISTIRDFLLILKNYNTLKCLPLPFVSLCFYNKSSAVLLCLVTRVYSCSFTIR